MKRIWNARSKKQLKIAKYYDYKKLIRFDEKKGFYCPLENGKTHCLGKSKVSFFLHIRTAFYQI